MRKIQTHAILNNHNMITLATNHNQWEFKERNRVAATWAYRRFDSVGTTAGVGGFHHSSEDLLTRTRTQITNPVAALESTTR